MSESDQQPSEKSTRKLLSRLVLVLLIILQFVRQLWEARAVSWLLLGGGIFITTNVFIEAASNTRPIQHIGAWWRRIGEVGEVFAMLLLLAVLIWMTVWLDNRGSLFLLMSFGLGVLLGLVIKASIVLVKRGVSN